MVYDFRTLSAIDFEDLVRDLVSKKLSLDFEGFGPGPDGGIDGRHASGDGAIILQSKHYAGSTFSDLKSAVKAERKAVDKLRPTRYLLATSQVLTPPKKDKLAEILGSHVHSTGDILGHTELNSLLREYPEVQRAHIKLWLSSSAILEKLIRSAAHEFSAIAREEIEEKFKIYVANPSFAKAREKLNKHKILVVSGAPGVGKTTLAEMLSYAYVGEDWNFVAMRDIDDGLAAYKSTVPQIFYFDDFLGRISLDRHAVAASESRFGKFIRRIQRSENSLFVLTTRAYILEEARRVSEVIGDDRLNMSKFVLNVGDYTRRVRARIFVNHMEASDLGPDYVLALTSSGLLPSIVDHENYNPRIVEWMTDSLRLKDIPPTSYAKHFINVLEHPTDIWDRAFREHIPTMARHLLICVYFGNERGERLQTLKDQFESTHRALSDKHNIVTRPTDYEDALRILEGSFVNIRNRTVTYVNPSVRDYLNGYLGNTALLKDIVATARTVRWARAVWNRSVEMKSDNEEDQAVLARSFLPIGELVTTSSSWRRLKGEPGTFYRDDLCYSERCRLLADLYIASGEKGLLTYLDRLVSKPNESLDPENDGYEIPNLIGQLRSGAYDTIETAEVLASTLEEQLVDMVSSRAPDIDELNRIIEECEMRRFEISNTTIDALMVAVDQEVEDSVSRLYEFDDEDYLDDFVTAVKDAADWAGVDASIFQERAYERMLEIRDAAPPEERKSFELRTSSEPEEFDDSELESLFAPLIR